MSQLQCIFLLVNSQTVSTYYIRGVHQYSVDRTITKYLRTIYFDVKTRDWYLLLNYFKFLSRGVDLNIRDKIHWIKKKQRNTLHILCLIKCEYLCTFASDVACGGLGGLSSLPLCYSFFVIHFLYLVILFYVLIIK